MSAVSVDSFLEEHGDALGRLAYHLTGDRESALDLLQDTFARLVDRWHRVAGARHPLAYVRRAVLHQHLDGARRRVPTPVAVVPERPLPDAAASYDETTAMWQALEGLTERQRAVLVLRYYEGCTDEEIAELVGCRRATVRSLAARGLAVLRTSPHLTDEPTRSRS